MEHTMLTWNIPNWITVILMAALGYAFVSIVAQLVRGRLGSKGDAPAPLGLASVGDFMGTFGNALRPAA